ncbi:MAG: hypothetical protein ACFE89_11250 [Candidatus Hodarchaeota archaeon]
MNLNLRLMLLGVATVIFTLSALVIHFNRNRFQWFYKFNEAFLALFGVHSRHAPEIRFTTSWLITTCLATVNFVLLVNISDAVFLLTGISGILLDPTLIPLALGGVAASILLVIVTLLPSLEMPVSWPTALGIVGFLHLLGVYFPETIIGQVSTFLFFAAIAIGFVGVFLALYLIVRYYLGSTIAHRFVSGSNESGEYGGANESS